MPCGSPLAIASDLIARPNAAANTFYHYACPRLPSDVFIGADGVAFSFITQLFPADEYCEPDSFPPNVNHREMCVHGPLSSAHKGAAKGMMFMRHPIQRLRSSYNFGRHTDGMEKSARLLMFRTTHSFDSFARFPGIAGCMTKMMIGLRCNNDYNTTRDDLYEAKRRLTDSFAFIGLTDDWELSICLFHAEFGGDARNGEFHNTRNTSLSPFATWKPSGGSLSDEAVAKVRSTRPCGVGVYYGVCE